MRRVKRVLFGLLVVVLAALALFIVPTIWLKPWSIDHFYGRTFLLFVLRHPMVMSQLGLLDGTPFDWYMKRLDDLSVAATKSEARFLEKELGVLRSYDVRGMTESQRLSRDVMDSFLANQFEGTRFMFHDYPVNQLRGLQSVLPDFMINTHRLKTPREAEHYVTRVSKFGRAIDQVIEGLAYRESLGVVPPRFVLNASLLGMRGFVEKPPAGNPLAVHFAERADSIPGLKPERRQALRASLEQQIATVVVPAYRRLIAACERLERKATDDDGVWKLPQGDAYYDWCLRNHTTTSMPADTIHQVGLREVARIQGQMKDILTAQGYPGADAMAVWTRVKEEPRFHYPEGDSGRTLILDDYRTIVADAERRAAEIFNVRPKAKVEIKRVPTFMEATTAGAYYQPPTTTGTRPGVFFANLRDPRETDKPGMRTLAYHEAVPGHHFQNSIAIELKDVPMFRKVLPFTAYDEGWGLYAERLALEQGFHPTAFDSLGALQGELFRAVRLVVDTGIHRKRWARQQAIDYMIANTGMQPSAVTTEIERYIVAPGQACAYKVGQLKILELRQKAIDRLGPRFELRKFHDVMLTNGALPLDLLEKVVDRWIAAETGGANTQVKG